MRPRQTAAALVSSILPTGMVSPGRAAARRLRWLPVLAFALTSALTIAGCASDGAPPAFVWAASGAARDIHVSSRAPADDFFAALRRHCGRAYAGRVVVDTPATPNSPFADKPLVMHVRECDARTLRIPFHVGDDRSRTWVLTRTDDGLRLKHDHRHADGSPDAVTQYGGDTRDAGSAQRQQFPVDAESIANFRANGLTASLENTWAMEVDGERFVYELSRPNGRLFRVEFDLGAPLRTAPPPPWGVR